MKSKKLDKRLFKHLEKDGKYYRLSTEMMTVKIKNETGPVNMNKPNMVAIYLNISDKAFENSRSLYKIIWNSLKYNHNKKEFYLEGLNADQIFFDFLESISTAIIFAYTAVEAFTNSIIPIDFTLFQGKGDKTRLLDNKGIQREISLNEKIKKILPKALPIKFDANKFPQWRKFIILTNHRNELIHLKQDYLINEQLLISSQLKFLCKIVEDLIENDIIESARYLIKHLSQMIGNHNEIPIEFCSDSGSLNELIAP